MMTEEEQEKQAIQDIIDESGCQIIQVLGDNYMPPYSYTIGLFQQFNHPEIICFGLSHDVIYTLLMNAKDRIEDDQTIEALKLYNGFLENEIQFIEVNKDYYKDYFGYGTWFYGDTDFPALQLVWPDKKHFFPWDEKFDENVKFAQPLLDRDMDFKFYESRNLGVFATNQVIEGELIKYVVHDEEGDWFFLEDEDADSDNIQIVSLEELVKKDPTLNTIYHLQYGWEACRDNIEDEWRELEIKE